MRKDQRTAREEMLARAGYYRWAAQRSMLPGGRDPMTGQTWDERFRILDPQRERFGREMNKASARFWLAEAARIS